MQLNIYSTNRDVSVDKDVVGLTLTLFKTAQAQVSESKLKIIGGQELWVCGGIKELTTYESSDEKFIGKRLTFEVSTSVRVQMVLVWD
jgi:hypothetical protein